MVEKTKIYLIGFDEDSLFTCDIYYSKKIKMLSEFNINLDTVFAKSFENLPIFKRYCLNHKIETISLEKDEQNYSLNIIRYNYNNPDKKNLAALVSDKMAVNLNFLFRQDQYFYPYLVK